jgi:hypothetical protein
MNAVGRLFFSPLMASRFFYYFQIAARRGIMSAFIVLVVVAYEMDI